jgi:hypothetical protein
VLKPHKELAKDSRVRADRTPLRDSWMLPSPSMDVQTAVSTDRDWCVYEAHISVTVTGLDPFVWTAYGLVDTYFSTEDSVETYHLQNGFGRPDPFGAGITDADLPIWEPREYFLKIAKIRMWGLVREWRGIIDRMETDIQQYVYRVTGVICYFMPI